MSPAAVAERTTRELTELLPINALPTALQLANAESEGEVEAAEQTNLDDSPPSEDLLRRAIANSLGEVREESPEATAVAHAFSYTIPDNVPDTTYNTNYHDWSSVPMQTNSPMSMPGNGFMVEDAYPRYTQDLPTIVTEDPRVMNSDFSDNFRYFTAALF